MIQANVSEIQLDGPSRFGESRNQEIGSERDRCGNTRFTIYTAACSPNTLAFPGADTMHVGAIGNEGFLSMLACRTCGFLLTSCWCLLIGDVVTDVIGTC